MSEYSAYVGMDVHKDTIAVAWRCRVGTSRFIGARLRIVWVG